MNALSCETRKATAPSRSGGWACARVMWRDVALATDQETGAGVREHDLLQRARPLIGSARLAHEAAASPSVRNRISGIERELAGGRAHANRGVSGREEEDQMSQSRMKLSRGTIRRAVVFLLPAALVAALIAASSLAGTAAAASPVPAATLTEINVPGTTPLSATAVDLAAYGYTAREFYASGFANRYTGADANSLTTASVLDSGNPYRTRVMVRYPARHKFNGTLAVEWANVTIGVDFEFATAEAWKYLLRKGYAVAIVSAQRVGVERAKTWSPQRYGDLSVDVDKWGPSGTSLSRRPPLLRHLRPGRAGTESKHWRSERADARPAGEGRHRNRSVPVGRSAGYLLQHDPAAAQRL